MQTTFINVYSNIITLKIPQQLVCRYLVICECLCLLVYCHCFLHAGIIISLAKMEH